MTTIITNKNQLNNAHQVFRRALQLIGQLRMMPWSFPMSGSGIYKTYAINFRYGIVYVSEGEHWGNRSPYLFRLSDTDGIHPDVEVNIPDDLNRNISGIFAITTGGRVLLGTRGKFNAKGQIPRKLAYEHFEKKLIRNVDDGDRIATIIPVAYLDSPTFSDDIGEFVTSVKELKSQHLARVAA